MSIARLLAAGLLGIASGAAVLTAGGAALPMLGDTAQAQETAPASASDAPAPAVATTRLDAAAVIDLVTARGFADITEVERDGSGWEVKATSPDGNRVEVYLNAAGEIVKTERD